MTTDIWLGIESPREWINNEFILRSLIQHKVDKDRIVVSHVDQVFLVAGAVEEATALR